MSTGAFTGVAGHDDLDEVLMLLCTASLICSGNRSISTAPDYDRPPASTLTLRDVLRSSLMYRFAVTIPKTM
ncbi:hypothetical protein P3T23_004901 [Paraburkholderia sp. GAS448]